MARFGIPLDVTPLDQPGGYIDTQLGLEAPQLDTTQEPGLQRNFVQRLLESLSGLEQTQGPPGLAQGLARGLGGAGTRLAQERATFEARAAQRQAQRDEANRQAKRDYAQARTKGVAELGKEQRQFSATHKAITPEDAAAFPRLASQVGQQVPWSYYAAVTGQKPEKTLAQIRAEHKAAAEGTAAGSPGSAGGASNETVTLLADAIEQGKQPADTKGFYRLAGPVKAELQKRGYDFTSANKDWQAVQRNISTLNGPQQTRLRQAAETAYESLDVIDGLSDELSKVIPRSRFPTLNRAAMNAAKAGLISPEAQSIATQLDAQITDVTSELGNVYMGGNSPTDHALQLAGKNLSGQWSHKQLKDATNLARKNLAIRRNSIINSTQVVPGQMQPFGAQPGTVSSRTRPAAGGWFQANAPRGH